MSVSDLIERSGLKAHRRKTLRNFSSGMRQRVKLLLAICTESDLLLLDEPSTNLDEAGVLWYNTLLEEFLGNRTLMVASNHTEAEFQLCKDRIDISQFKNSPG